MTDLIQVDKISNVKNYLTIQITKPKKFFSLFDSADCDDIIYLKKADSGLELDRFAFITNETNRIYSYEGTLEELEGHFNF